MSAPSTPSRSIASFLALPAACATLVPLAIVGALAWPRAQAAAPEIGSAASSVDARALDTAPVRHAALELVASARRTAPAPTRPAPSATAPTTASAPDVDAARIQALGTLTERLYAARDVRRKDGKAGAELRKPFSLDELGGAQLTKDLALDKGARMLVLRDGTVLGPAGAALPAGLTFGADAKTHATTSSTTEGGVSVSAVRYCPYGEVTCLVDLTRSSTVATPPAGAGDTPAAASVIATEASDPIDTSALDAALATLAAASKPSTTTAAMASTPARSSRAPFFVAWLLAVVVGALGIAWAFRRADALARAMVGAIARLHQAAAGRAPDTAPSADVRELAALHGAITGAARGLSDAATRVAIDEKRRARADEVAQALAAAAAARDLSTRLRVADVDDPALLSVVDGANRLLESLDHSVLRWQSHAKASGPRAENAQALEARAEALKPLAALLSETAERLLRLAQVEGAPHKLQEELKALGTALGQRGKVARSLVDALLLDLATERPQARHDDALVLLRHELSAFKTSETAPERVAALKDLPPAEIGERVAADRA